jgi:hypothetical protein
MPDGHGCPLCVVENLLVYPSDEVLGARTILCAGALNGWPIPGRPENAVITRNRVQRLTKKAAQQLSCEALIAFRHCFVGATELCQMERDVAISGLGKPIE